ncbi:MAG: hypothetical protein AUH25_01635 [Thaumarchaeota archaeon 13_1_40CM_38_12]|nr:MAG: hypothetical protein AUH25_01635 [Thaumarchaeota archaeon 13_1_40CM_38_12]OLC33608.1 MAG: hypothetical protein AUH84_06790 [Thaumarchaeota archaeon 13_1_40CM_4_38_7]OLD30269.1 MAG: hypothetical protein AUI62_01665 [Thaumarchaeota archaeon 13_1_40CM_2_39_7]
MDNDEIIFRILKFLHEKHFAGQPMYYFNVDEIITGSGLDKVNSDIVFGNMLYLHNKTFVNGLRTLGVAHPISMYITELGIDEFRRLDDAKKKEAEHTTEVGHTGKSRNIFGHSVADRWIAIGAIAGMGLLVIAVLGFLHVNPFEIQVTDQTWKDRPILDISFRDFENNYPKKELQFDGQNYYIDIIGRNSGQSIGYVTLVATGFNAKVTFDKNAPFEEIQTSNYLGYPNPTMKVTEGPLLVLPDKDAKQFSVVLTYQNSTKTSPHQQTNLIEPTALLYQKNSNGYTLIEKK